MNDTQPQLRRKQFKTLFKVLIFIGIVIIVLLYPNMKLLSYSLLAGGVLLLGFGLPHLIGWSEREKRASEAKKKELAKWDFHSRDREGPWINYIDYPLIKKTPIANKKFFCSEWLIIYDGFIVVNPGPTIEGPNRDTNTVKYDFSIRKTYAWDGCSPKYWFFWMALLGTPDFADKSERIRSINPAGNNVLDIAVLWQQAHHASLVHDALYQYLHVIPISKQEVDQLFHDMLIDSGFNVCIAKIYHLAVHCFGGRDVRHRIFEEGKYHNFRLINELDFLLKSK